MINFYTEFLTVNPLLLYIFQTLPVLIVYVSAVKYCLELHTSKVFLLMSVIPTFILGIVFNVFIKRYFQDIMVVHNIFTILCQFIFFMIIHLIFNRKGKKDQFNLLIITIILFFCANIFVYIRIFLLNFSAYPFFSVYFVNWHFLFFLLLLPIAKKFLIWLDFYLFESINLKTLLAWLLFLITDLFLLFVQISSVTTAVKTKHTSVIYLSSGYLGKRFIKWLSPSSQFIIEPVDQLFPFATTLVVGAFILIGSFFFLLFLNMYNQEKIAHQEQLKYELTQYVKTLEDLTKNIRKNHHDFSNILYSLGGYIYQPSIDEIALKKYFETISHTFEADYHHFLEISKLRNLAVPELKTLIFTKLMLATKQEISFEIEIEETIQQLPLDGLVLSRTIGILVDNALEAAAETSEPYVHLALIEEDQRFLFIITNSTVNNSILNLLHQDNFSTKGEDRGLGLSIVRSILHRHSETISLKTTQNTNEICQTLILKKE